MNDQQLRQVHRAAAKLAKTATFRQVCAEVSQRLPVLLDLALEKAVGHLEQPAAYPLRAGADSLERRLVDWLKRLPANARERVAVKMRPRLQMNATERQRVYGRFGAVNLRSAQPVIDSMLAAPPASAIPALPPRTGAELVKIITDLGVLDQTAAGKRIGGSLRLKQVECLEDTPELGKDEIGIFALPMSIVAPLAAASTLPASALGQASQRISLGEYKKGDLRPFNLELGRITLDSAGIAAALLQLTEIDSGDPAQPPAEYVLLAQYVGVFLTTQVTAFVTGIMLGLLPFGAVAPPVTALLVILMAVVIVGVFTAVGALLITKFEELIRTWYGDDPFIPALDTVALPLPAGVPAEQHIITMQSVQRKGSYRLTLAWSWAPV